MLERENGVPSRARVLWANLSAQGARVRERWLTRPLAPCSQLKAHSREREIGSQDCYSNMVKQCLTMFCRETLEYDTFCRETLKYDTFCRKNLDSALWAKKNGKFVVRADSTFYATLPFSSILVCGVNTWWVASFCMFRSRHCIIFWKVAAQNGWIVFKDGWMFRIQVDKWIDVQTTKVKLKGPIPCKWAPLKTVLSAVKGFQWGENQSFCAESAWIQFLPDTPWSFNHSKATTQTSSPLKWKSFLWSKVTG